jgi:glycosyltransferase involved in cell wall biosynthesis
MKILFYGQATGGNASLWFRYLDSLNKSDYEIHFLARTVCDLDHNFKIFAPYGYKKLSGLQAKIRNLLASRFILPLYVSVLSRVYKYNLVILQGNYTPRENLRVLRRFTGRKIINIYGSDFYRKYLRNEFSDTEKSDFRAVIDESDSIYCNWYTTYEEFLKVFPNSKAKLACSPWGVTDSAWFTPVKVKRPLTFLSTRALHSYNNVDMVVEAFCIAFASNPNAKLTIVGGYGDDSVVVNRILELIDKYNANSKIVLHLNDWFEGERLVNLYDENRYNICFGDTDQLTLSIPYGYFRGCTNILSDLDNYKHLNRIGFSSHVIARETSIDGLVDVFNGLDDIKSSAPADRDLALQVFDMNSTFKKYTKALKV